MCVAGVGGGGDECVTVCVWEEGGVGRLDVGGKDSCTWPAHWTTRGGFSPCRKEVGVCVFCGGGGGGSVFVCARVRVFVCEGGEGGVE